MKTLGFILSFYAVFLMQLHSIVPHSHKEEMKCEPEVEADESAFLHLLQHFFMVDIGDEHLEHFLLEHGDEPVGFAQLPANEIEKPNTSQSQIETVYQCQYLSDPLRRISKDRAPPLTA